MFNSLLLPIVITIATMTATATPLQTTLIVNFVSELKEAGGAFRFEVADTEGGNTPPPPNKWSTSPDVVGAAQFNETDEWSLIFWQREGQTALFQLYNVTLAAPPGVCHLLWDLDIMAARYEGTLPSGADLSVLKVTEVQPVLGPTDNSQSGTGSASISASTPSASRSP